MAFVNRRDFQVAATTAVAPASLSAASAARVPGANDRVRLGFIGVGNRGDHVLDAFLAQPDAQVVAVSDIHAPYVDFAAAKIGGSLAHHYCEVELRGTKGTPSMHGSGWEVVPETIIHNDFVARSPIDRAKEKGHRATSTCLIANIAHRTRSLLEWDAVGERFPNSARANAMLDYRYRKPNDVEET